MVENMDWESLFHNDKNIGWLTSVEYMKKYPVSKKFKQTLNDNVNDYMAIYQFLMDSPNLEIAVNLFHTIVKNVEKCHTNSANF